MNKRLFKMVYKQGKYTIEQIHRKKTNLNTNTITNEVRKINQYTWVCMDQNKLVEYAEIHKTDKIKKLQDQLLMLQSGGVIFV